MPRDELVIDEIRVCEGCGQFRHVNWFVAGARFCHECREAQKWRVDQALRHGTASESEILSGALTQEMVLPGGQVVYSTKDDVPPPTTKDLNDALARQHISLLDVVTQERYLSPYEFRRAMVPLSEDPELVEEYQRLARETPDPRKARPTTVVDVQIRTPRGKRQHQAAAARPRKRTR